MPSDSESTGHPHGVNIATKILGSISLILMAFCIISLIVTKKYQKTCYLQIACLFFSTLMSTFAYLINLSDTSDHNAHDRGELKCQVQGFLLTTFDLSQYIWGAIISLSTTLALLGKDHISYDPSFYTILLYFAVGFFFPMILGLIIFFMKNYDYIGHWCWVDRDSNIYYGNYFI